MGLCERCAERRRAVVPIESSRGMGFVVVPNRSASHTAGLPVLKPGMKHIHIHLQSMQTHMTAQIQESP